MKLGLPAKLAIFLLMASPFGYAASNDGSSCRQKAELSESASPRFIGASTCSSTGSVFTGNDHCQVRANPGSTCELDQYGVWVGRNYYFTGCLAGTECGNQPDPDPDPEDPAPEEPEPPQPPEPLKPVTPIDWQDPTIIGGEFAAVNSNISRLSDSFKTLSTSLNKTISDSAGNQLLIAKRIDNLTATQNALKDDTTIANQKLSTLQSSQNYGHADIKDNDDYNFNALYNQAERHNNTTQQGINDIKQQANQLQNIENQIEGVMGTVTTANNYVQEKLPEMAFANSDSFGEVLGGLSVVEQRLDSLNTGGGGGTDMTVTNNLIRETIGNIQGLQQSINTVGQNTSRTVGALDSVSWSLSDLYGNNLEQLWETQGLRSDLNTKLSDLKTAIEDSSGSGQGDTVSHEKLDGLGQKLDGIKGSLDGLSDTSGFAQDLADGTAQGKSDLNDLLDGYNADTMLTDRFKAITDEAEKTLKDSGLSKFSDPSKFIDDSGMIKPSDFDDLISFAQRQPCSPYRFSIHGTSYEMNLCPYAADSSAILNYVFAALTAIFCFVMISQTLINERLS
jgi:hypothetical protein